MKIRYAGADGKELEKDIDGGGFHVSRGRGTLGFMGGRQVIDALGDGFMEKWFTLITDDGRTINCRVTGVGTTISTSPPAADGYLRFIING